MAFNSFQIPYDLRVLVEKTVDEARTVNGRVMNSVTQILAIWVTAAPRNEFTIRITATNQWGIRWGSQSVEEALTLVSEIVKAKDLLDLFSIQSRYAYRQIANYDFQTREFGRLIAGATQGVATRDAN